MCPLQVTGSKNEEQVLNAIEAYMEFRPELAHRAINQLFDIARIQHCSQLLRALQVGPLSGRVGGAYALLTPSLRLISSSSPR